MTQSGHNIDIARLQGQYRTMSRIRAFEEAADQAQRDGLVGGAIHLSIGQEAVAAGVCGNLDLDDMITTTHRGHGHCLAKGADAGKMMLELFGRQGGACGGKGGSMHIADFSVGMLGANGVVGAGIPIAVGAAQATKLQGRKQIVVCFFGDGAVNRGPFLEGLNWAAVYELPVLFVCEGNGYAAMTEVSDMTAGPGPSARARALGIEAFDVDGNDVRAVDDLVGELIRRLKNGVGPFFVTANTFRLMGHTAHDPDAYRDREEVAAAWDNDPITNVGKLLVENGLGEADLVKIQGAANAEMAAAVAMARAAPAPDLAAAFDDIQDLGAPVYEVGANG